MVVVAVIGLLAAIAIPNMVRARTTSQANACINNLKQIDNAMDTWALENGKSTGTHLTSSALQPYLGGGRSTNLPCCPTDPAQNCNSSYTVDNSGEFIIGLVPICFIQPTTHICPYASQTGAPSSSGGSGGGN